MLLKSKYRRWTAAILLAIYAFVATPVEIWHHHAPVSSNKKNISSCPQYEVMAKGIPADDCPICSHKNISYWHFSNDIAVALPIIESVDQPQGNTTLHQCFVLHFSNKGPPLPA